MSIRRASTDRQGPVEREHGEAGHQPPERGTDAEGRDARGSGGEGDGGGKTGGGRLECLRRRAEERGDQREASHRRHDLGRQGEDRGQD
jgi:hypothetical protein